MKVEPQKEHHWLQKLVGEWTTGTEMVSEDHWIFRGQGQDVDGSRKEFLTAQYRSRGN